MKNSLISRISLTLMLIASVGVSSLSAMQQAFSKGSDEQVRLAVYTTDVLWAEGQSDKKVFLEIFKTATPTDFEPFTTALKQEFDQPVYRKLFAEKKSVDQEYSTLEQAITANIMIRSVNALKAIIEVDRQPYSENIKRYFSNEGNQKTFLLSMMKQIPEAYKANINEQMRAVLGTLILRTIKSFFNCEKINMPNLQKIFPSSVVVNGITRQEVLDLIANEQSQQMEMFVRMSEKLRQDLMHKLQEQQIAQLEKIGGMITGEHKEQTADIAKIVEKTLKICEKTTREKILGAQRKGCWRTVAIISGAIAVEFLLEVTLGYEGPFCKMLAPEMLM